MADYNLALQKRPNFGNAYNNRGTLYLRKQALQSALDDFSSAIKYSPKMLFGYTNPRPGRDPEQGFRRGAGRLRHGPTGRTGRAPDRQQPLPDLYRDGQV
jgi:tetratricopeptide (TPR) repeat protein